MSDKRQGIFTTSATADAAGPLTAEMLFRTYKAMVEQSERPRECPHKTTAIHPNHAKALHGTPCPWCGVTLVYGPLIGSDE